MARTSFTTAQVLSATVLNTLQASVWTDDYATTASYPYTLVIGDAGKQLIFSSSTAGAVTVPLNATVAFALGVKIQLIQTGTGTLSITQATAGVTFVDANYGSVTTTAIPMAQYMRYTIIKIATDTWLICRDGLAPDDLNLTLNQQVFS